MGTRNVTKSGFFVRKKVKKHFISWLWSLVGKMFVREQVVDWQPVVACICCHSLIEERALYCCCCGTAQRKITVMLPQTEAMCRLSSQPARQTEELRVDKAETSEMRAIRIANEGQFLRQYLVERRLYCWLYLQIQDSYQDGQELITASKKRGFQQYPWLLSQLEERGTVNLIAEFKWRCELENVTPFQATFTRQIPKQEMRNGQARAN